MSIKEWLEQEGPGCKPCYLSQLAEWYRGSLHEKGYTDLLTKLEGVADADVVEIAATMDEIKGEVCSRDEDLCQEFADWEDAMVGVDEKLSSAEPEGSANSSPPLDHS